MIVCGFWAWFAGLNEVDYSLYPGRELQLQWLRAYLEAYKEYKLLGTEVSDTEVEVLYVQVNRFALVSRNCGVFWSFGAYILYVSGTWIKAILVVQEGTMLIIVNKCRSLFCIHIPKCLYMHRDPGSFDSCRDRCFFQCSFFIIDQKTRDLRSHDGKIDSVSSQGLLYAMFY